MLKTTNYALNKIELKDSPPDITVINPNWDTIDTKLAQIASDYTRQIPFATTVGSANAYVISDPAITAYVMGMAVCIKIHAASTGASTLNWSGLGAKPIKRSNGTAISNQLKAGGVYTLRYDGTNFILQGEGGNGTATASDLLSGKTATTDAGDITGSMTNNGPTTADTITLASEGVEYTIPQGYHSGLRKLKVTITNMAAAVIKAGVVVGGITGTFTANATAIAADMRAGKTAGINGSMVTGTMSDRNISNNWTADDVYTSGTGSLYLKPPAGAYAPSGTSGNPGSIGGWVLTVDPDFTPPNIWEGANVLGLQGSLVKREYASGYVVSESVGTLFYYVNGTTNTTWAKATVSGLSFQPSYIVMECNYGGQVYKTTYDGNHMYQYAKMIDLEYYDPNSQYSGGRCVSIKGDVSPAYVINDGFCLPCQVWGQGYYWRAYK